jgi:hypothetical protein
MADVCYAEGHLCQLSLMLSVANQAFYTECLYAECRYAECHYAECIGAASEYLSIEQTKDFLQVYQARPVIKIFNWF